MKNIVIFGSTGSIGKQVLEVIRAHPRTYKVVGIVARDEITELVSQIKEFKPKFAVVGDEAAKEKLSAAFSSDKTEIFSGEESLKKIIKNEEEEKRKLVELINRIEKELIQKIKNFNI